ncbi:Hsp70 protein that interacts with Zuo1p [Malassezia vespertilionis]|uniref:Ssz1p n=1 Tax=Malassezia vespertilionis TaxID=2020962 RepID=A0A2N1JEL5_9BASI|nr:Hsp70 protein that interacts with Zuo1p [Malassezia vespertilionis]PKI84993.1 Ssz1p [Malassezia vespertilionis]WFD05560.1 Hsp70 protein that interacts with Zuo1p [Malassezia vespertilionis]
MSGAVIGINLGNTYGSIACINQHGRADVIANENGERQIATRIAFNGDQVYNGNEATPQLVRNAPNVIDRFVNLVGRSFSELSEDDVKRNSAQVIDAQGTPSFKVQIDGKETLLSAHDVLVRFIGVLFGAAKDFMSGVPIIGTVLSIPGWFNDAQIKAVETAATDAGLHVLQIIPIPAAALVAYGITAPGLDGSLPANPDGEEGRPYAPEKTLNRNVVVVDFGGSSFDVTVVAARAGIYALLAYEHDKSIGGNVLDDLLVQYFAKEFTKKTKVTIRDDDSRAWAKLRNEAEMTKRALSASNSAPCSVESLAEGLDFSGSVNRMRLNLLAGSLYSRAQGNVKKTIEAANLDPCQIDEVVLVGGAARLSGLAEQISYLFAEDSGVHITQSIDADQVIARGNAVYAQIIVHLPKDSPERKFIESLDNTLAENKQQLCAPSLTQPIGIVLDAPAAGAPEYARVEKQIVDGQLFVTIVPTETPLPTRCTYRFPTAQGASASMVRIAKGTPLVRTDMIAPEPLDDDDDDDEPLEPEEVKTAYVKPDSSRLAELVVPHAKTAKTITVEVIVLSGGQATIEAKVDAETNVAASAKIGA